MRPDLIQFRYHRNGDRYAVKLPSERTWTLHYNHGRTVTDRLGEFFDHRWSIPVHIGELLALTSEGHTSIRTLAEKYLRLSIGNSQPHRDIQRQVFVDILHALGDEPNEVYDRLAAARVIDVSPTESALDGADILLARTKSFAAHDGLNTHEHELLELAEHALILLHASLKSRAGVAAEVREGPDHA